MSCCINFYLGVNVTVSPNQVDDGDSVANVIRNVCDDIEW